MKHALRPSLFAWLMVLLLVPAAATRAADEAPAPDYQTLVDALFEKADVVKITGYVVDGIDYDIDRITTKAPSRQKLKDMFSTEKPRYLGRDVPPHLGEYFSSRLNFTWVDAEQKELGSAALLEGDRLLINGSLLFSLSPTPGKKNLALLREAANFANPLTIAPPCRHAELPPHRQQFLRQGSLMQNHRPRSFRIRRGAQDRLHHAGSASSSGAEADLPA